MRTTTTQSTRSVWSISESDFLGAKLKLDELVELIRSHISLQRAEILSTEGYKEWSNGILHRFLVLELRRTSKASIWLRIDRRMQPNASKINFVLAMGESPAYDTVRPTLSLFFLWHGPDESSIRPFCQPTKRL